MAVDSFETVLLDNPRIDPRHGIVHCQITDMGLIERIKKLNLLVYAQPIFARYDRHIVKPRVGGELEATSYNWRALADRGIHLSGSSDCPVEKFDIMPNIYCAVTGKNPEDETEPSWLPSNCLTLDEALTSFTIEGAYAAYQENERGTITIGKYADITVLESDVCDVEVDSIKDIKVYMTIVNGGVKFEKGQELHRK